MAANVINLAEYKAKKNAKNVNQDFKRQEMDDRLWLQISYCLENFDTGINRESPFK